MGSPKKSRGTLLIEALSDGVTDKARLALIDEAGRLADRLDELDSIIAGKGVLRLMKFRVPNAFEAGDEVTVHVTFDHVLAEARQQAMALKQILVALGLAAVASKPEPAKGGSFLDELSRRRETKGAQRPARGQQRR
jgi:hypothetical protein